MTGTDYLHVSPWKMHN